MMTHQRIVLDNNLKLISVEMPSTETITVFVLVACGSKYENKEINGISHFLEHMAFKGTKKRPTSKDVAETIDRIGGTIDAFTGKEYTGYYTKVSDEHLEIALDFVADLFLNAKIDSNELEKERKVIFEEINLYEDMPMRKIGSIFESLLYNDQPAGWEILGTKETLSNITAEAIREYRAKFYRAPATVICVAGNIKHKEVLRKVKFYFKNIRQGPSPTKKRVVEDQKEPGVKVVKRKTDQAHLVLGVRAFDLMKPERFPLALATAALSGGMSSRLFQTIRGVHGLAYYIYAEDRLYTDSGYLAVQTGVDTNRVFLAVRKIISELKKLKSRFLLPEELNKVKEYYKGKLKMGLETSNDVAEFYGLQELLRGQILTPEEIFEQIEAVNAGDIKKVCQSILKPERINLAIIGPFEEETSIEFKRLISQI